MFSVVVRASWCVVVCCSLFALLLFVVFLSCSVLAFASCVFCVCCVLFFVCSSFVRCFSFAFSVLAFCFVCMLCLFCVVLCLLFFCLLFFFRFPFLLLLLVTKQSSVEEVIARALPKRKAPFMHAVEQKQRQSLKRAHAFFCSLFECTLGSKAALFLTPVSQ